MTNKKTSMCLGLIAILLAVCVLPVTADVVLSVDLGGNTNVDTGAASASNLIRVYISSDSSDELFALTPEFMIEAGTVVSAEVSAPGSTGTAGFFGAGNLNISEVQLAGTVGFIIDQELTTAQSLNVPASREKWFEFEVNTTGLANGTYAIQMLDPNNSFFSAAATPFNANNDLTFTVSAVPEPGSVLLLFGIASGFFFRRRRT